MYTHLVSRGTQINQFWYEQKENPFQIKRLKKEKMKRKKKNLVIYYEVSVEFGVRLRKFGASAISFVLFNFLYRPNVFHKKKK